MLRIFRRLAAAKAARPRLTWHGVTTLRNDKTGRDEFYFRDQDVIRLEVRIPGDHRIRGGTADFVVTGRNRRGNLTPPLRVKTVCGVPLSGDGTHAELAWNLADRAQLERWAFATIRVRVRLRDREGRRRAGTSWSPPVRHSTRVAGFYGFGPTGELFSNAEIRRLARAVGGVPVRRRAPAALRRLARQVPPSGAGPALRLFGYSLGGEAAVKLAHLLARRGAPVELLVAIDPVVLSGAPLRVPANVRRAASWFQRNGGRLFFLVGRAGRGVPLAAADPAVTRVENLEFSRLPSGLPAMHEDMPFVVSDRLRSVLATEFGTKDEISDPGTGPALAVVAVEP